MSELSRIDVSDFAKNSMQASPVNEMTERFALDFREGIDINLGVGYVNDKTIPGDMIKDALSAVISDPVKYRNALNYGGAEGSPALKKSIRNYYLRSAIGNLTEDDFKDIHICIGANGATSILDSFAELMKPGIVITADPFYYIYCDTLQRKGFEIITIPEDREGIQVELLTEKLAQIDVDRLRFFYIVTVNNPSCTILFNDRRAEIVSIAKTLSQQLNKQIPVLFDKAYEDIVHDTSVTKPASGLKYDKDGLVVEIGTFSKVIAPALRIGYMLTRNNLLVKLINQKVSDIGFSAPLINQEITSWLLDNYITTQLEKVNSGYREKAKQIELYVREELGDSLVDLKGGSAGFYFYLTLTVDTHKDSPFYTFLNRKTGIAHIDGEPEKNPRLVYIPGEYCVHKAGNMTELGRKQLRISYGFETIEQIKNAVILMRDAITFSCNSLG